LSILLTPHPSTFIFFFSCSAPPRHLPSFPTRRSSDLSSGSPPSAAVAPQAIRAVLRARPGSWKPLLVAACRRPPASRSRSSSSRSEEHTSELQSRFDLVCRLLLEKKKTIK